jgi:threonine/homoserine/homoserine lactone efflux protein
LVLGRSKLLTGLDRSMLLALLQFIPLALAAVTPTMVIFVTALLAQDGNAKRAFAVVFGRYLGLLVIGFLVLFILNKLPENPVSGKLDQYEAIPAIFLVVGIGLLAVAAYNLVVKKVPGDKNEESMLSRLKRLNAPVLFVACFATAFVSIRQISLVIAGTAIIKEASSRPVEELVLLIILCLAMIWPMLIPLGITVGTGERGDALLERLRSWMSEHQQAINSAVLAFFGGILVAKGIAGI